MFLEYKQAQFILEATCTWLALSWLTARRDRSSNDLG